MPLRPFASRTILSILTGALLIFAGFFPFYALPLFVAMSVLLLAIVHPPTFLLVGLLSYAAFHSYLTSLSTDLGPLSLNASRVFLTALTGVLVLATTLQAVRGREFPPPRPSHHTQFLFAATCAILALTHPHYLSGPGLVVLVKLLSVALVYYFVYAAIRTRRDLVILQLAVGLPPMIAAMTALFFHLSHLASPIASISVGAARSGGSLGGPVTTATVCFAALPVFMTWRLHAPQQWLRALALAGFAAFGAALFSTLTRTAFVGATLFFIFYFVLQRSTGISSRRLRRRVLISFALLALIVAVVLAFLPTTAIEARLSDVNLAPAAASPDASDSLGSGRGLIWKAMIQIQLCSSLGEWLFGHGIFSSPIYLQRFTGIYKVVHNSFGQVLFDFGLVGLFLYLLALWHVWRDLAQAGLAAGEHVIWRSYFAAYVLSTIFFNSYVYETGARWFTFIALAQALAAGRLSRQPRTPINSNPARIPPSPYKQRSA